MFTIACIQLDLLFSNKTANIFIEEKILNCENNNLFVLLGNILLFASPKDDDIIFIESVGDIVTNTSDVNELIEFIGRKQIYAEIEQIINSHDAKWIPYQSMSNDDGSKTTITSVERI